ncbi:hypothetical protein B4Q13_19300, partial [Lacticaseibacillus rhamnosus]
TVDVGDGVPERGQWVGSAHGASSREQQRAGIVGAIDGIWKGGKPGFGARLPRVWRAAILCRPAGAFARGASQVVSGD